MTDYIKRADAIDAVCKECSERWEHYKECDLYKDGQCFEITALKALPSAELPLTKLKQEFGLADAVSRYAEWLEKIIVDAETMEWLCEDTPCKEWCDENCHYSSIKAVCLRHIYEVSKGGDTE